MFWSEFYKFGKSHISWKFLTLKNQNPLGLLLPFPVTPPCLSFPSSITCLVPIGSELEIQGLGHLPIL